MNLPQAYVFPILTPPPSSLPIPSLWVVPVHQPQASSTVHQIWTATCFIYDIIHISMPFSQPSHPLPLPQSPKLLILPVKVLL